MPQTQACLIFINYLKPFYILNKPESFWFLTSVKLFASKSGKPVFIILNITIFTLYVPHPTQKTILKGIYEGVRLF